MSPVRTREQIVPKSPKTVAVAGRAGEASQQLCGERSRTPLAGDVLFRDHGVKVRRQEVGERAAVARRNDEVLLNGEEMNGYVKVTTSRGEGWVKAILLGRR